MKFFLISVVANSSSYYLLTLMEDEENIVAASLYLLSGFLLSWVLAVNTMGRLRDVFSLTWPWCFSKWPYVAIAAFPLILLIAPSRVEPKE